MRKWMMRAGLAQLVAWVSFGAAILTIGLPLWIPSPFTLAVIAAVKKGA